MDSLWNATLSVFSGNKSTLASTSSSTLNYPGYIVPQAQSPLESQAETPTSPGPASPGSYFPSLAAPCEPLGIPLPPLPITAAHAYSGVLYLGTDDGRVWAYSLSARTHTHTFTGASACPVTALASSSRRLLVGSADGAVTVYSLATGGAVRCVPDAHNGGVTALCVADGTHPAVYSAGEDGVLNEWDAKSLRKKWVLTGHVAPISMVVWAGNGRVFSGDVSGCVKGWDTSTGQCIANFEGLAPITTFTLGRDLLYVATSLGTISVIDIESGQTLRTLRVRQQHNDDARSQNVVSLCLARGRLYSLSRDGLVSEWDVKRGRAVRSANAAMGPAVALCSAGRGDVLVVCSGTVVQLPPAERERPGTEDHALGPSDSASNVASDAPDDVVALKRQLAAMRVLQSQQQQIAQQQAHSTASSLLARAEDAELALQAAKELLVSYRSELELTQQAHAYAFSYLSQSSNRTWFEIEREIRGLHEIMSEPIPRPGGEDGDLEDFCPKRKAKRCWQRDDLWDSDADEDDANAIGGGGDGEPPWWRVETGRTNLADLKWWREEQPSRPAITVPSVEPYAIPELTMMAMDDNDDSDDDQDLTEEIGERSSFSDDELGTDEADHPTPHPTIRVRGTFRLPDGSIQITPSTAPAFPVPRRITVPAATAIAAARSLATSPPRTSPHNSAVSRQRIRTPTRESRRRSAAPAAAVAVVTPTPSATGSSSKRTSSASWFAPIQNWVETVVAGAAEPQNGDVASSGGSEAGGTVAPPLSSAGSAGTEVKKVRVRTADVYRFEEGMVNPS